jgi:ATP-dependent Clp protease protease subunit
MIRRGAIPSFLFGDKMLFGRKKKNKEEAPEEESVADLLNSLQKGPEQRSIMFIGEVSEEKAGDLISALLVLSQEKETDQERGEDIKLYVSTFGGSAHEMFAIYDVMNWCKQFCDIRTIGMGKVMSAGTLILAAGTKGKRTIGKNCQVMLHSVNAGYMGDLSHMKAEVENMNDLQDTYIQCLANETSMTKRQIQTLISKKLNVYLSADEAIEKGLADGVL